MRALNGLPETWIGWLNFLVVQWFFFRLGYVRDEEPPRISLVIGPVLPLSGWWSRYYPTPWIVRFNFRIAVERSKK